MIRLSLNIKLLIVFIVVLVGFVITEFLFTDVEKRVYNLKMQQAVQLTKKWYKIVKYQKEIRDIKSDAISNIPNKYMMGDDFTEITTTLGTLNAKEISTNPDFSALVVRWLKESDIKSDDKIGIIISGSFPAIAISTLAAMQTLDLDVVLMSSLGASSYGANQPEATWLDIESWLIEFGDLKYKSILVSRGAESDAGLGMMDEGIEIIKKAADRNKVDLFIPESLNHSIQKKADILMEHNISLLINIGGNQSALGRCAHSNSIPNGYNETIHLCNHEERGIIQELNSKGIPLISFLNIKDIAYEYGMDMSPGKSYMESIKLFEKKRVNKVVLTIILVVNILSIWLFKPVLIIKK